MKKLIAIAAATTLLASVSVSSFAAEKSVEDMCKDQAKKEKIATDKVADYVKACVKKHNDMGGMGGSGGMAPAAPGK
jgi:hypothetical protein